MPPRSGAADAALLVCQLLQRGLILRQLGRWVELLVVGDDPPDPLLVPPRRELPLGQAGRLRVVRGCLASEPRTTVPAPPPLTHTARPDAPRPAG